MPAFQFYETTALITDGQRNAAYSILSASRDLVDVGGSGLEQPPSPYEQLLDDAIQRAPLDVSQLPATLAFIGAIGRVSGEERPRRFHLFSEALRLPELTEDALLEWSRSEYPEFFGIGVQAASLSIVPVESSPLETRTLVEIGGSATLGLFAGGPILMILAPLGLVAVRGLAALTGALWEGARPEVVDFGGDTSAWALDSIRKRLGIQRRDEARSD
jgi:hypothetical protein